MTAVVPKNRRTAKADPILGTIKLFDPDINRQLADDLAPELRRRYFTRSTMPPHWLSAILENQPTYRARKKSVALDFRDVPDPIATEFVWLIERQVRLGMRIHAAGTCKLSRQIAMVTSSPVCDHLASLLDLEHHEWLRAIRKVRTRHGDPLALNQVELLGSLLGRILDLGGRPDTAGPVVRRSD